MHHSHYQILLNFLSSFWGTESPAECVKGGTAGGAVAGVSCTWPPAGSRGRAGRADSEEEESSCFQVGRLA